jgi:DNA-binding transcriptional LysR family regulator
MSRWSREIKLANLDLNLLVALDALLQERSVTRAAAVMGVSQPALSSSLAKLRRHFGDELLTRVGNSYQLSPLGIQLSEQTSGVLAGVVRVFSSQPDFDPSRSDREFVVECSDYVAIVLGPTLMELLAERAPQVRLNLHHVSVESIDAAA